MSEGHTMFTDGSCYSHASKAVLRQPKHGLCEIIHAKNGFVATFRNHEIALLALRLVQADNFIEVAP